MVVPGLQLPVKELADPRLAESGSRRRVRAGVGAHVLPPVRIWPEIPLRTRFTVAGQGHRSRAVPMALGVPPAARLGGHIGSFASLRLVSST
jgi:hypothetical protein